MPTVQGQTTSAGPLAIDTFMQIDMFIPERKRFVSVLIDVINQTPMLILREERVEDGKEIPVCQVQFDSGLSITVKDNYFAFKDAFRRFRYNYYKQMEDRYPTPQEESLPLHPTTHRTETIQLDAWFCRKCHMVVADDNIYPDGGHHVHQNCGGPVALVKRITTSPVEVVGKKNT